MDIAFPEPKKDLLAQFSALLSGRKPAMYIAPSNALPGEICEYPDVLWVLRREGRFLTKNKDLADQIAGTAEITDDDMARWLGYPESKRHVKKDAIVQVRTPDDAVVMECATNLPELVSENFQQKFPGHEVLTLGIADVLRRRRELIHGHV